MKTHESYLVVHQAFECIVKVHFSTFLYTLPSMPNETIGRNRPKCGKLIGNIGQKQDRKKDSVLTNRLMRL